jgi:predicted MFS family arabinose efflux permease
VHTSSLSGGLLAVMAVAAGIAVANLYYAQPLLADIGRSFQVSPSAMGLVITLAQLGFATGVVLLVPLGDSGDRRRLILATLVGAVLSLLAVAVAPSYVWLASASFFVGAFSVTPQMFVPFAAHLAAPERRGQAVGVVISGLLVGILASRAASGYLGELVGWRAVYWIASALTLVLAIAMARLLPPTDAAARLPYVRLLGSLRDLWRTEPVLRESALAGAMLFGTFSAFWSTLAFKLEAPPFHYGSRVAGLFGLIGVAGAGAATLAGRLADRLNPRTNVRVALLASVLAFLIFAVAGDALWGLVVGVTVLDAAVQAGHVTSQSRIHRLAPDARNRLTTIYMMAFFLGGAAGSGLAAYAWQRWRWAGVCAVGIAMSLVAAVRFAFPQTASSGRRNRAEPRTA